MGNKKVVVYVLELVKYKPTNVYDFLEGKEMIKKVDFSYYAMLSIASLVILVGVGAYWYPALILLPILGLINIYFVTKRRRSFIDDYSKYHCAREGGFEIPDQYVKFLYYGKEHLYMTSVIACNIMPYNGLEVQSVTDRTVTLVNKMYLKTVKVDISQIRVPNYDKIILKNIEEAKSMDIHNPDLKREIEEREAKQKAIAPTALLFILMLDTFGVLIPTVIALTVSEKVAAITLLLSLVIATIITIPVTIKYYKQLMRYKLEIDAINGYMPHFYKLYIRFTFLPAGMLLCLWFIAIVMSADVLFNIELFS